MKRLIIVWLGVLALGNPLAGNESSGAAPSSSGHGESGHGGGASAEAEVPSPLTPEEQALVFDRRFLRVDDHGAGYLEVQGEPLGVGRILSLSPWDLMDLVQTLSGRELALSRFGSGRGSDLTQAWRLKLAAFAASAVAHSSAHPAAHEEDPFDPALVLWDPGFLQTKNSWGQWTIRLDRRDIVQGDLATLSPLEVQQAVAVLTGRTYPVEFVLENLESFRAQLSVVPRAQDPVGEVAAHH